MHFKIKWGYGGAKSMTDLQKFNELKFGVGSGAGIFDRCNVCI